MLTARKSKQFRFSAGDKVFCYEPDPTKAKVLYESRVINISTSRDENGRKVCEYLIHFLGWNNSWDRYVKEEYILPYTDENKALQAKLAEEAASTLKNKKKHKLPPIIKESLSKKMCTKNESKDKAPKSPSHSSSDSDSSEDEAEKEIIIEIPNALKTVLEEDMVMITEQNRLVKIPCEQSVVVILEAFVKYYASVLLNATPPKKSIDGQKFVPSVVKNKLNLCKETMNGIRVFFDFTLPHLLLYGQEKKQFYTIGTTCSPIYDPKSFSLPPPDTEEVHILTTQQLENLLNEYVLSKQKSESKDPKGEHDSSEPRTCTLALRFYNNKLQLTEVSPTSIANVRSLNPKQLNPPSKEGSVEVFSGAETKLSPAHREKYSETSKKEDQKHQSYALRDRAEDSAEKSENKVLGSAPKGRGLKKSKAQLKKPPTRILRSRDKQASESDDPSSSASPPHAEQSSASNSDCPADAAKSRYPTRRSATLYTVVSPPLASSSSLSPVPGDLSSPSSPSPAHLDNLAQPVSNYFSSSNSSSHSTCSGSRYEARQSCLNYRTRLLDELAFWHMVPESLYQQVPAPPSLTYGSHHLLRLFVKLPMLMSKMSIKQKKLVIVLDIIEKLLIYLAEKKDELFPTSVYIDSCEIFPEEKAK